MADLFSSDDKEEIQNRKIAELEEQIQLLQQLRIDPASVKNSTSAERIVAPISVIAGEDLTNGDAVRIGLQDQVTDFLSTIITQDQRNATETGGASNWSSSYQTFKSPMKLPERLAKILLYCGRTDTVSDPAVNFRARLYNSAGSLLTTSDAVSVAHAGAGGDPAERTFTFSTAYTIEPNTIYKIRLTTDNANVNHVISISYQNTDVYADGAFDLGGDLYFKLQIGETGGRIYKCKATTQDFVDAYYGINNKTVNAGDTTEVICMGHKKDYTNLTAGEVYYLTDTRGTIGTTAGTVSKVVGLAISTNILLIKP